MKHRMVIVLCACLADSMELVRGDHHPGHVPEGVDVPAPPRGSLTPAQLRQLCAKLKQLKEPARSEFKRRAGDQLDLNLDRECKKLQAAPSAPAPLAKPGVRSATTKGCLQSGSTIYVSGQHLSRGVSCSLAPSLATRKTQGTDTEIWLALTAAPEPGRRYEFRCAEGNRTLLSTHFAACEAVPPAPKATVAPPPVDEGPIDLVGTLDIVGPVYTGPGQLQSLTVEVRNRGKALGSGPTVNTGLWVEVYLADRDLGRQPLPRIESLGDQVEGGVLARKAVRMPQIPAPGQSQSLPVAIVMPKVPIGSHHWCVRVDSKAQIAEINEDNNLSCVAVAEKSLFGARVGELGGTQAPVDSGGVVPTAPDTQALIEALSAEFLKRIRTLSVSRFDKRCPFPFTEDSLGRYLRTAWGKDIAAAQNRLYDMFVQLGCVSARRYAGLHRVFSELTLQRADLDADMKQMLAPLALLFFELGYGEFRYSIIQWLIENADSFKEANDDQNSVLSHIGLFVRQHDRLWQMGHEESRLLLDSAGNLTIGDCSLAEYLPVENEDGETTLFCPRSCIVDVAAEQSEETDTELESGLLLTPEAQQICDDLNKARADKPKPSHAQVQCIQDFVESATSNEFLACQADAFATRGALLANFDHERTRKDIYVARNCRLTDKLVYQLGRATENLRRSWDHVQSLRDHLDELQNAIRIYDPSFNLQLGAGIDRPVTVTCDWCGDDDWNEIARLTDEYASTIQDFKDAVDSYHNNLDEWRQAYTAVQDHLRDELLADGSERCSPLSEGCSDACGIVDQMVQEVNACWDQATAREEPEKGGVPPGAISRPDPRGPGDLPGSMDALQQCLMAAGGQDPETPPSNCPHYTRCPNGEMPNRQNCTCGVDQRVSEVPDNCLMVAQCTDSQMICCPRPIGPEDTEGGGGGFPGAPPGDPLGATGRAVRVWASGSHSE